MEESGPPLSWYGICVNILISNRTLGSITGGGLKGGMAKIETYTGGDLSGATCSPPILPMKAGQRLTAWSIIQLDDKIRGGGRREQKGFHTDCHKESFWFSKLFFSLEHLKRGMYRGGLGVKA